MCLFWEKDGISSIYGSLLVSCDGFSIILLLFFLWLAVVLRRFLCAAVPPATFQTVPCWYGTTVLYWHHTTTVDL